MAEDRVIRLRYPATCRACGLPLAAGASARWHPDRKSTECVTCRIDPFPDLPPPPDTGIAGGSARAEWERRTRAREQRIRDRFPRLGGLLVVLTGPPQSTTAWKVGATGERKVAERLAKGQEAGEIVVLHDRSVPGTRGNLDHLVVGRSGVYVIDTKRYVDQRIEQRGRRLFVGGRDRSRLVDGMSWQVDRVMREMKGLDPEVPIRPVLCFVDAKWSLLADSYRFGEVTVMGPRALARTVVADGPLLLDERLVIGHWLAENLPGA